MLRSNPSARADAGAWAATILSLLVSAVHASALNALNLSPVHDHNRPVRGTTWLPFGKIYGAQFTLADIYPTLTGGAKKMPAFQASSFRFAALT